MDREKIMRYLEECKEDIIRDVMDFISIPSISNDLKEVGRALDYALELGQRLGFSARSVLDGQVGIIEAGCGCCPARKHRCLEDTAV